MTVLALLFLVFWLTICGANYPSRLLEAAFAALADLLHRLLAGAPWWLSGALIDGVLATTGQVVAVMLPPVMIFFPLFALLEEAGYLPRLAFLMDSGFARCGACGKQALTTCMGFGCNAAGVMGCRIIDSPRERRIAILTNSFVPCNGRFPALIALSSMLFAGAGEGLAGALALTGCVLLGVAASMGASALLSHTVLRGMPSAFALELPPYRRPNVGRVILRAWKERTLAVLARAAAVAAPAGLVLWCLGNVQVGDQALLTRAAVWLDPLASWLGLTGQVLLAFFLSFPANELTLPLAASLGAVWTPKLALCAMIFFLFHWPCSTTVLTIRKETGSWKWTLLAVALPTAVGAAMCAVLNWML